MRGFNFNRYPLKMPSYKSMESHFAGMGIDIQEVRNTLEAGRKVLLQSEAVQKFEKGCYFPPSVYELRLVAMNIVLRGHGIVGIKSKRNQYADYINMGDTYVPTIIWYNGMCHFTTVGDFMEKRRELD